jgi:hypothetical protein
MLSVDFLSTEGDFDGATEEIEALIKSSDGDDAIPYVFKANTLAQKVRTSLSSLCSSCSCLCVLVSLLGAV